MAHASASSAASAGADDDAVAFLEAPLPDAKELQSAFAAADIEVALGKRDACGTSCGCGSKLLLFARRGDLPRVAAFLDERWRQLVDAEGTLERDESAPTAAGQGGDACPACGTPASDAATACVDCGLVWG